MGQSLLKVSFILKQNDVIRSIYIPYCHISMNQEPIRVNAEMLIIDKIMKGSSSWVISNYGILQRIL